MNEPLSALPPEAGKTSWARAIMMIVVSAIFVGGGLFLLRSCSQAARDLVRLPGDTARSILPLVAAWNSRTLEVEFAREWTQLLGTNYLQFTTLKQGEVFTGRNEGLLGGHKILPSVVVDARVPVEYTYYVDLEGAWKFDLQEKTLAVTAPKIRFNKPAIDASKIEYSVRKGSMLRDERAVMEDLRKGLAQASEKRAEESIALVRDLGRKKIAEFVEKWALRHFSDAKDYQIKVLFADEVTTPAPIEEQKKL